MLCKTRQSFFMLLCLTFLLTHSSRGLTAEDTVTCTGRITDTPGNAVADAYVFLYEMSYDMTTFEVQRTLVGQAMSDSEGQFTLTSRRAENELQQWATILVAKKEMGLCWASWNLRQDKTTTLQLDRYGKLAGRVVDESGQPVTGASVRALLMLPTEKNTDSINYFDRLTEKTDEAGRFKFDFIPTDATAEFYIEVNDGKNYCTTDDGITGDSFSYRCNEQQIEIELLDKLAMENSVRSISYGAMLANSRYLHIASGRIQENQPVELAPFDTGIRSVSGMIIEEPFIPLEDVTISIYDVFEDNNQPFGFAVKAVGKTTTDSLGKYVFERTDYDRKTEHSLLIAYKDDYALLVKSFSFTDSDLEPLEMKFGHKAYTGRVVDTSGKPVAEGRVSAYVSSYQMFDYGQSEAKEAAQTDWLTATTDVNGEFLISNIPSFAKAEFSIKAEGYAHQYTWPTDQRPEEMTIPAGGAPLLFTLERACAICGCLINKQTAAGIPGEKIFVVKMNGLSHGGVVWTAYAGSAVADDPEGNNQVITTDSQGIFATEHLSPGTYKISLDPFIANDRKWHAAAQKIELTEGQTDNITIPAVCCQTVTIRVQDTEQQPLADVGVALKPVGAENTPTTLEQIRSNVQTVKKITYAPLGQSQGQVLMQIAELSGDTILPVTTGDDGVAVFRLPPGDYAVESISKPDYELIGQGDLIHVDAGADQQVLLVAQLLSGYEGRCVTFTGRPVAGVTVRQLGFSESITTTDKDGSFLFQRESLQPLKRSNMKRLLEDASSLSRQRALSDPVYGDEGEIGIVMLQTSNSEEDESATETIALLSGEPIARDVILLAFHPRMRQGGWAKYNWERQIEIPLNSTTLASGKVVDERGEPAASTVRIYAYPEAMGWIFCDRIFREKYFFLYDGVQTDSTGSFRFQLIPEFSYILEITAEGHGRVQKKIISSKHDPQITKMIEENKDYIVVKVATPVGEPQVEKIHNIIWVLRETAKLDFGQIQLRVPNQTLSGIVVDRMGNPLEGYRVFVSGEGQLNEDPNVIITDSAGHFLISGLCEGEVEIYAENGEYKVQQRDIKVGRDDLRIVSPDHPASEKPIEVHADDSLCDFEIILINQDTQEQIQYERADVRITPENGDRFKVKLDDAGRYRVRLKEGNYTIDATGYPIYDYKNDVEVEIKAGLENKISIPIKKHPVIEGIVHLPEVVSTDEIEYYLHPDVLLSIFEGDMKIAGDGQFSCKISLSKDVPANGWLWVNTRNRKYVSRTKFSLSEQWVEITLQPEATIKLKKPAECRTLVNFDWRQEEYANKCSSSIGFHETSPGLYQGQSMRDFFTEEEEYFSFRGLVAGQEDLSYSFKITAYGTGGKSLRKKIIVHSKDLEPGQTTIIEIPAPEQ